MIWLAIACVAVLTLAPFLWSAWRGGLVRGRRDAALALHRAQLAELDRDLAEGRLLQSEHAAAQLEVQRRLLAEADQAEVQTVRSSPMVLVLTGALVPAFALILYAIGGHPDYVANRQAALQSASSQAGDPAKDQEMINRLRAALTTLDPHSDRTREGYKMLGNAELSMGHLPEAAEAWRTALSIRFDPELGAETAEIITDTSGRVTSEAAGLFKRALAEAPAGVPWRKSAEKRLAEAGGS